MIVPRNRLLVAVAAVTLPLSLALAVRLSAAPLGGILVAAIFVAVATADAVAAQRGMAWHRY
jgi:hypothetical protein